MPATLWPEGIAGRSLAHTLLSRQNLTWQILWLLTGMIADVGGALTLCEQNTFVEPAELAHRASEAVRQL